MRIGTCINSTDSSRLYVVSRGYSLLNKHDDRWHNRPSLTPTSHRMNNQLEPLFTTALGLQLPWHVAKVELNTAKRRIDFEVEHTGKQSARPACGIEHQLIHDRVRHSWRHLDVFEFEACLHAVVPRVQCSGCGKTTQLPAPWAHKGCGFSSPFESRLPGSAGG